MVVPHYVPVLSNKRYLYCLVALDTDNLSIPNVVSKCRGFYFNAVIHFIFQVS